MIRHRLNIPLLFLCCGLLPGEAAEVHLAVASNFAPPMKALVERFEKNTGHQVLLSFGSTGKQYAQILHGAPYDAFFAADVKRPKELERQQLAVPSTRFTYAIGRLVLWSAMPDMVDASGRVLQTDTFRHLAIANPDLAPYGAAAREVLQSLSVWAKLEPQIVRGENVGQAFHFTRSGNAELGFVGLSQLTHLAGDARGSRWVVPEQLYQPIEQQVVLLTENHAAITFLRFIRSDEALQLIRNYGYNIP